MSIDNALLIADFSKWLLKLNFHRPFNAKPDKKSNRWSYTKCLLSVRPNAQFYIMDVYFMRACSNNLIKPNKENLCLIVSVA